MANNNDGGSFILGFLVGGIVGTIVGILTAPRPGSETRAELIERSESWRNSAEELATKIHEQTGPAVEGVRERVGPAFENVRDHVGPTVEAVREHISPIVEQISRMGRSGEDRTSTSAGRKNPAKKG